MRTWAGALMCLVLGCGSSKSDTAATGEDTGNGEETASMEDAADEVAEAATACGTNVGDVLCDLDLQGYERDAIDGLATAGTFGPYKVSQVLATGTQRYAFVFNSAYW